MCTPGTRVAPVKLYRHIRVGKYFNDQTNPLLFVGIEFFVGNIRVAVTRSITVNFLVITPSLSYRQRFEALRIQRVATYNVYNVK